MWLAVIVKLIGICFVDSTRVADVYTFYKFVHVICALLWRYIVGIISAFQYV